MDGITAIMAQHRLEEQSGESLHFERCKGGYFSDREEFGLRIDGPEYATRPRPTPDAPESVPCVRAGTEIRVFGEDQESPASTLITPCDIYGFSYGDRESYYPANGRLIRKYFEQTFDGSEAWYAWDGTAVALGEPFIMEPYFGVYSTVSWEYLMSNRLVVQNRTPISVGYMAANNMAGVVWFGINLGLSLEETKQKLVEWYAEGNPLKIVYLLKTPIIEHYDPQPIYAPVGTCNVLQSPADLAADLSATMLVRR